MNENVIMVVGLGILAVVSGMLGLGVAFAAVPFLSLFLPDIVNMVQPLTLLLNGFTALFATLGFARSGLVVVGSLGAFAGARVTSLYVPPNRLKQLFGLLIVVMTGYKLFTMIMPALG